MAGCIADGEENRPVEPFSLIESRQSPHAPMHRIVLVLDEIGARRILELVAYNPTRSTDLLVFRYHD